MRHAALARRIAATLAVTVPVVLAHAQPAALASAAPATQTIVAVGDSITKGAYDLPGGGGWVARLATKLQAAYPQSHIVVHNAGIGGDTSWGVLVRLQHDVIAYQPEMVIISIGTNDFRSGVPASVYADHLQQIIARLQAGSHPPILVLASMLPFAGLSPSGLRAEQTFDGVVRQTAAAHRIGYLDLFDQWLALGPVAWHALRHDTVHPNGLGYELMSSITAAYLEAGYLSATGNMVAPAVAPTCADSICPVAPAPHAH